MALLSLRLSFSHIPITNLQFYTTREYKVYQIYLMTEWKGYYVQFGQQFPMEFADLQIHIATPQAGSLSGSGADIVGTFTLQGSYDATSSAIKFKKQYDGAHAIYYQGKLNQTQTEITGHWGFEPGEPEEPFKLFK